MMSALPSDASAAPPPRNPAEAVLARLKADGPLSAPLWQGSQLATSVLPTHSSGFAELDAELPGGGWPSTGLTELLLREAGSGEIRLLAPTLGRLGQARELVWVAPPHLPYAPALHALGLPLARFVWVLATNEANAAWATEQVLRSGCVGAVLWWSAAPVPTVLRRLHLAAQEGNTPLFALRPWAQQWQSSPAPLRLGLETASNNSLRVQILKRRGPNLSRPLHLSLAQPFATSTQNRGRRFAIASEAANVVVGPAPAVACA